jgi:hypothetical protein
MMASPLIEDRDLQGERGRHPFGGKMMGRTVVALVGAAALAFKWHCGPKPVTRLDMARQRVFEAVPSSCLCIGRGPRDAGNVPMSPIASKAIPRRP